MISNANSHFAVNPVNIDISRSVFERSNSHKTTFNAGKLVPIFIDEYLPGDTFTLDTSMVVRMTTPIHPIMDNLFIDVYFFSVPNRLVWDHWKEFNGENTAGAWSQTTEYEIPQVIAPEGGWQKGDVADYFGIPTKVSNISINALPFRAYALIYNEWFRNQNVQVPAYFSKGDSSTAGSTSGVGYVQSAYAGGDLFPVSKFSDYFTAALPEPQKGADVLLPLGERAPVYPMGANSITTDRSFQLHSAKYMDPATGYPHGQSELLGTIGGNLYSVAAKSPYVDQNGDLVNPTTVVPSNLWADLGVATAASVNQLRMAFQLQKLYEKDARGGTRYTELIKAHFGITSPDARQQRPEYLGGKRIPINISQVLQTSSTDTTSPQGNTAGFSLTADFDSSFTASFTEHGYVIGLACVRYPHTYQYGIERMWSRKDRLDFYLPVLANIGEQAILNKEIYAQGRASDEEAFGYQEAWAEYRYKPSRVSGAFRSNYDRSLDVWHFADKYESQPYLSDEWINETASNVDRTLAVSSELEDQFIGDFYFKYRCARPMPTYSIPGLIDHH